jgi:transposase-like protein
MKHDRLDQATERKILRLREQGILPHFLARRFGISKHQLDYALRRAREEARKLRSSEAQELLP